MQRYEELRIRVRGVGPGRYLVLANGPVSAADIVEIGDEPAAYRARFEQLISAEMGEAPYGNEPVTSRLRDLGRDVFGLLFGPALTGALAGSYEQVQQERPPSGLRLRFDLPPELRQLPIETLTAPAALPYQSMGLNFLFSLARTLHGPQPGQRLPDPLEEPAHIRLLAAVASPSGEGLGPVQYGPELEALGQRLPEVAVQLDVLKKTTRRGLEEALAEQPDRPTILLLIAHGTYDTVRSEGCVYLESEDGTADRIPGHLLSGMLVRAPHLRLVVLNLCSGAGSSPTEPYSGLAQALVGSGMPAVVAMHGAVSDGASAAFSPALLQAVCTNRTIDEAVGTARRSIAELPGHTAIEWTTPVLFVHEAYRHGWLFKAREIRDDPESGPDPLSEGAAALRAYKEKPGNVSPEDIMAAARFLRDAGDWDRVRRMTQHQFRKFATERGALGDEAAVELAWPDIEALCATLATEQDASGQLALVSAALRGRAHAGLAECLSAEVAAAVRLAGLLGEARQAEESGDWEEALRCCTEVLAARPAGFRDAAGSRDAAAEEVDLAGCWAAADLARTEGRWSMAADGYALLLARRPAGYRDAAALAAYCTGRSAEEEGRWAEAVQSYDACTGHLDTAARAACARGRAAVETGQWALAQGEFVQAPDDAEARRWRRYCEGRVAEDEGRWAAAVDVFGEDPEFRDSAARALSARAQAAVGAEAWLKALGALEELRALGEDVGARLADVQAAVFAQAEAAEERGAWQEAAELYAALPGGEGAGPWPDARARCRYAKGRIAQDAEEWEQAAEFYGAIVQPGTRAQERSSAEGAGADGADGESGVPVYRDSVARLHYVLGRACETREQWADAASHFALVPTHTFDCSDRLLYTRGRAADTADDWDGVIDGFGRLPDTHRGGDVGARRHFARARLAERQGEWGAVLSHLAGTADDARDGLIGLLRRKAGGRLAEQAGDWAAALGLYSAAEETDEELARLREYARGRAHEGRGGWTEALAAYAGLPDAYEDVEVRSDYVRARLAEPDSSDPEGWRSANEAYGLLPAEFEDVAQRAAYARIRLADAEGDWHCVALIAGELGAYRDAGALGDYAIARLAEAAGDWQEAVDAYGRCAGRRDANGRRAYARGRALDAAGQWSAAIEAYGPALGVVEHAEARWLRLRRLMDVLPWADGLAGEVLVADRCTLRDETFPYQALRSAGITPGSPSEKVKDATYTLMEQGAMSWQARVAWDRLRIPAQRMQLDALLYRVRQPRALRDELSRIQPGDPAELLDDLCHKLPDDAPLLVCLARDREEAVGLWEERLRTAPDDMDTLHALTVARYWEAQELEESGAWEHAAVSWEFALAYAAALISADGYWVRWLKARAACYRQAVAPEDAGALRWELGRHFAGRMAAYCAAHAAAGRTPLVRAYQGLTATLEIELDSAGALREVGGLPLHDGAGGGDTLAAGPGYLRMMGLEGELAHFVADLDAAGQQGGQQGTGVGEQALRDLRCAFSELAPAFTAFGRERFEQANTLLPEGASLRDLPPECPGGHTASAAEAEGCPGCAAFLKNNPAYAALTGRRTRLVQDTVDLAVRAHLVLARTALAHGEQGLPRAKEEWAAAIRVSVRAAVAARTKKAILRMVLGRAEVLAEESGERMGDCLDEAVILVESAIPLLRPLGNNDRGRLEAKLSDLLSFRGVWRGYTRADYGLPRDHHGSEDDLRRSLVLNPESVRARNNLVRGLIFGRATRIPREHRAERLSVLREALGLLDEGLERVPTYARYWDTLGEILEDLEAPLLSRLSPRELGEQIARAREETERARGNPRSRAGELAAEAASRQVAGDLPGALHCLVRATRIDRTNATVRHDLMGVIDALLTSYGTEEGESAL
ncbi:CHAT domain-containing protein [Streptomyces sp. NPDC050738]|uniref:CHAT domain-containing protein n=1 Tax=Streptomyces sp. NPDC050738 TaxID=3154744 RepID=UPI00343F6785